MSDSKKLPITKLTELERYELAISNGYSYNKETGHIVNPLGKNVTSTNSLGYVVCYVSQKSKTVVIRCHRFAWFLYYGKLPQNHIDHIDRDKTNNKITNLRDVTNQQNSFNQKAVGYYWRERRNHYEARITVNGKKIHLGCFKTEEDARNAYAEGKKIYHIIPN